MEQQRNFECQRVPGHQGDWPADARNCRHSRCARRWLCASTQRREPWPAMPRPVRAAKTLLSNQPNSRLHQSTLENQFSGGVSRRAPLPAGRASVPEGRLNVAQQFIAGEAGSQGPPASWKNEGRFGDFNRPSRDGERKCGRQRSTPHTPCAVRPCNTACGGYGERHTACGGYGERHTACDGYGAGSPVHPAMNRGRVPTEVDHGDTENTERRQKRAGHGMATRF